MHADPGFTEALLRARPALLRTARSRLRDPHRAEDAVSETLLAALERPPPFDDPARIRAWLFGILKHKVVDQTRRHAGDDLVQAVGDATDIEQLQPRAADAACDPAVRAGDRQFVDALARLLEQLPPAQARVFVMRECEGLDSPEICGALGISAGNLWVLLHRARVRLRGALRAHFA